jgi:hypothetical protein
MHCHHKDAVVKGLAKIRMKRAQTLPYPYCSVTYKSVLCVDERRKGASIFLGFAKGRVR